MENLISNRGLFPSDEGQQGAANEKDSWGIYLGDAQGFGRVDAASRAGSTSSRLPPPAMDLGISFFLLISV